MVTVNGTSFRDLDGCADGQVDPLETSEGFLDVKPVAKLS